MCFQVWCVLVCTVCVSVSVGYEYAFVCVRECVLCLGSAVCE